MCDNTCVFLRFRFPALKKQLFLNGAKNTEVESGKLNFAAVSCYFCKKTFFSLGDRIKIFSILESILKNALVKNIYQRKSCLPL